MNKFRRGFIPLIPLLIIGGSFLVTAAVVFVKTDGFRSFSGMAKAGLPCSTFNAKPNECNSQVYDDTKTQRCRWVSLSGGAVGNNKVLGITDDEGIVVVPVVRKTTAPTKVIATSTKSPVATTRPTTAPTRPSFGEPTDVPSAPRPSSIPRPTNPSNPTSIPTVATPKGTCIDVPRPQTTATPKATSATKAESTSAQCGKIPNAVMSNGNCYIKNCPAHGTTAPHNYPNHNDKCEPDSNGVLICRCVADATASTSTPKPTPDSGNEQKVTCNPVCGSGYVCRAAPSGKGYCAKIPPTPTKIPATPTPTVTACVNMCYGKGRICLGKSDVEYCGIWYDPSKRNSRGEFIDRYGMLWVMAGFNKAQCLRTGYQYWIDKCGDKDCRYADMSKCK